MVPICVERVVTGVIFISSDGVVLSNLGLGRNYEEGKN